MGLASGTRSPNQSENDVLFSLGTKERQSGPSWGPSSGNQCERADFIVDSGASTSAVPAYIGSKYPLQDDPHRKVYTSASGHEVTNQGIRTLKCSFQSGETEKLAFKVMPVQRALVSVSQSVLAGNRIVFDSEANGGSYIMNHRTGSCKRIYEKGGVFVLPCWIEEPDRSDFGR